MRRTSERAFTIVEMLVVISIIAILLALLFGGVTSALKTSKNSKQLSDLRQLFTGWTLYANQYNDQCLPGFLSVETQKNWKVSYRMNGKIEGQSTDKFDRAVTQTYPWRLAPYLDYSWELLQGNREDPNSGVANSLYTIEPIPIPSESLRGSLQQLVPSSLAGATVALQPPFGYNAFYLGGWWDISKKANAPKIPRPYFANALRIATGEDRAANVLSRTLGGIINPDRMTVFCPAAYLAANASMPGKESFGHLDTPSAPNVVGVSTFLQGAHAAAHACVGNANQSGQQEVQGGYREADPLSAGAAWVTPPWLGTDRIWSISNADSSSLAVYTGQAVPLMRYSNQIPAAKGDGSTKLQDYGDLNDMREWLNLSDITAEKCRQQTHTGTISDQ